MKEVKPWPCSSVERSCNSRIRSMCSTRSFEPSPNPITLVALVVKPIDCASPMTRNQFAGAPFLGETSFRTSSTSISAPPPGKPCMPACLSSTRTSWVLIPHTSARPSISIGLKQSRSMVGCSFRRCVRSSVYHENGKLGFTPPCMRIREPPMASNSRTRADISS